MAVTHPETVHGRIMEFFRGPGNALEEDVSILEAALFVEDVFGIVLSDEEIRPETLGTPGAMERLVLRKIGGD